MKVMVVDDAEIIREMIKDAAISQGWEIAGEATNGKEAIERYPECNPDAVTLDLVMPEYDGLYALKGIRDIDPKANVIVISAVEQTDIIKESMRLGASDFIVKPFDSKRLQSKFARLQAK